MFCELPRSADRTPYLVGLRRRRGSRACQTELIAGAQFYKEYALRSERFALGAERIFIRDIIIMHLQTRSCGGAAAFVTNKALRPTNSRHST
jgi:hypothetical protein